MDKKSFERTFNIRFSHCDPSGTVFFGQYLALFNDLIESWFDEALGISYADMLDVRHVGLPTAHLECDFKAISRMGDVLPFGLSVERLGNKSLTLNLRAGPEQQARVKMRQVLVFSDLKTHQSIAIPADIRRALEQFTS